MEDTQEERTSLSKHSNRTETRCFQPKNTGRAAHRQMSRSGEGAGQGGGHWSRVPTAQPRSVPGNGVWSTASPRLCFHSLVPGTHLSSPKAASKEFNTSLGCQKPQTGLHPHSPSCSRPPRTAAPLFLINKPQVVQSNKTLASCEFVQFVLAAHPCSLPTTRSRSTKGPTLPDAAGIVMGQHNKSPANP